MSPDAAACARNAIYFIDQRFDVESAKHIKEQLENLVPNENGYWFIDEVSATAERRDATGKTVFTFNPAYARVFFVDSINSRNPAINLPVHEPAGEWLVVYDIGNAVVGGRAKRVGTGLSPRDSTGNFIQERDNCDGLDCNTEYKSCDVGTVESARRSSGLIDAVGRCAEDGSSKWKAAFDTPRFESETDASYYQRMDELRWGRSNIHM